MNDQVAIGMIRLWAGTYLPTGYQWCNGGTLQISQFSALYSVIGTTYGGDGKVTFNLPNLQSRIAVGVGQGPGLSQYDLGEQGGEESVTLQANHLPMHNHDLNVSSGLANGASPTNGVLATMQSINGRKAVNVSGYSTTGSNAILDPGSVQTTGGTYPHNNLMPYQTLNYIICTEGQLGNTVGVIGQIMLYAGRYSSALGENWLPCNGQALNTSDYEALYSCLGNTYGGTTTSFKLPDFRSRTMIGTGISNANDSIELGERFGVEAYRLIEPEIPAHSHALNGSSSAGNWTNPSNAVLAAGATSPAFYPYTNGIPDGRLNDQTISRAGLSEAHNNIQPYIGLTYLICAFGTYPSQTGQATDYLGMVAVSAGIQDGIYSPCNGSKIPDTNQALMSIVQKTFDPSGKNYLLPDLRAAVPMGAQTLGYYPLGSRGGASSVFLNTNQMPEHNHQVQVANTVGTTSSANGNFIASTPDADNPKDIEIFGAAVNYNTTLNSSAIGNSGGSQAHFNMQPYLGVNMGICVNGLMPPQD